ncbi:hypothetical protein HG531_013145 [Fusarium graminearum]|nr:hypothetical protein HG531_013145 [Fusarium graminearum]
MWPLPNTQYDIQAAFVAESLEHSQEKVFSDPGEEFEIEVGEFSSEGFKENCLESASQLQEHISTYHDPSTPVTQVEDDLAKNEKASFFLLEPAYGWSHLPITKSGAMKLFSALRAFPELYQYVAAFSVKTFPRDEGFAGFNSDTTIGDDGSWTTFARAPGAVNRLLGKSLRDSGSEKSIFIQDWPHLHTTCFSSVKYNLRKYINYLDREIADVFDRVIMAGVEPGKLNEFDKLQNTARDIKELQYLSDQVRRVISIVDLNIMTLECFQKKVQDLVTLSSPGSPQTDILKRFLGHLSRCYTEHQFALRNASSVLNRAKATSDQLRDTVSIRNGEFNKSSTEMTSRNTSAMCHLANKSGREAHVVKTLTVLALVFVPAGFVADFLQMGFVSLKKENPMQWSAAADLKIYAILSIPLISLTMLIYVMVEIIQRAKERKLEVGGGDIV